jgi:hypothetical protein
MRVPRINVALAALSAALLAAGLLYRIGRSHLEIPAAARAGTLRDCAPCHADLFRKYAQVGMARSFRSLANSKEEEPPASRYYHALSGRQYEVRWSAKRLVRPRGVKISERSGISL